MGKFLVLFVLFMVASYSQVEARGGLRPCLASCCFGDPRLGYYMNQGEGVETTDWITCLFRPAGAFLTGGRENGVGGFLISCFFGNRAGQHWDRYNLRIWEILGLFFAPIPQWYMYFEQFQGKTWDEVVAAEGARKIIATIV